MIRSPSCLFYAFGTCNDTRSILPDIDPALNVIIRLYLKMYYMCGKCEKLTRVNLPDIVKIPNITLPAHQLRSQ